MAWYHPELLPPRADATRARYVNQQWPPSAETPHGAWEFHERLIPNSPVKPIRIWMQVGDRDLFNPNVMRDNMHDWVVANENMAKVLAAKGYTLPVRVRPQRRALRSRREAADVARSAGMAVEGISSRADESAPVPDRDIARRGRRLRLRRIDRDAGRAAAWTVVRAAAGNVGDAAGRTRGGVRCRAIRFALPDGCPVRLGR